MAMSSELIFLPLITLIAATVNGALGYGFSSITVPLALLFLSNRVLNPALVLIEVVLNAYVLVVNRSSVPGVWRRVLPIMVGLAPGIVVGTTFIATVNPDWIKLWTFGCLIPLILLQAAGYRRQIKSERSAGAAFGSGVGVLYAVTTISGPPLAMMLSNQGFVKRDFRAALALVRLAESSLTAVAFLYVGMFTKTTLALSLQILPSLAVGIPLGALMIRRLQAETFRRICMSFDVWVVAFGLTSMLRLLAIVDDRVALGVFVAVASFDLFLLYRFFSRDQAVSAATFAAPARGDLGRRELA
jgi:uncharacterized membrane protein YfcA